MAGTMSAEPAPTPLPAPEIALVTYSGLPEGAADDAPLFEALRRRGVDARFVCWDDPEMDWSEVGLTVLRSPWDYFKRVDEFLAWLDAAEFQSTVVNSAAVARWNIDKRYFADLEGHGVRVTPTVFVERGDARALTAICEVKGWTDVVVKPTISGAAYRTARFSGAEIASLGEAHLAELCAERGAMVQPYLMAVKYERERSLMFIDGAYSHAVLRSAFNPGGEHQEDPYAATADEIDFAETVLGAARAATGDDFAYARVDILPDDDGLLLMELEVTEPSLFFVHRPEAAEALADLLAGML